ncbi:MAG: IS110 family transposase [Planctomycetes bacterium]|nr:IS110 family transposase [Planctomycetota bacterium]
MFERIRNPAAALKARPAEVRRLLQEHRIRRIDAEQALQLLRQRPVFSAPGTATAATAHLLLLGQRVRLVNEQLKTCKASLEQLLERLGGEDCQGQTSEQRDVAIILSMPGIGMIVAATLLGEAAEPLAARDYPALRALAGVAPVTRRSGKRHQVVMRAACHLRLRNAAYHLARVAAQREPTSKARYTALRARGKSHGQALRCVADRLLGVLCAMLRSQSEFRAAIPQAA